MFFYGLVVIKFYHIQGLKELAKNTGRWAKQAFTRLDVRVLRPGKLKTMQQELGGGGQEGEKLAQKMLPQLHSPIMSPEEDVKEEYLSSLD